MALAAKTILAIDDDADQLLVVAHCIKQAGHVPLIAQSIRQGVELLYQNNVALIVSDIRMAEIDGCHLRDYLTANSSESSYHDLPIILISASLDLSEKDLDLSRANYFCSKRELLSMLSIQIREALELYRHSAKLAEINESMLSNT